MKDCVFWDVTPCGSYKSHKPFFTVRTVLELLNSPLARPSNEFIDAFTIFVHQIKINAF
jgi:hypothetical protein